ncbi:MAG: hypothetical protein ACD_51C00207G0004 [uncultured bacterium]|nr:MAG: hypothetical protein ACD_51C00207G0004 [uncultured bacterium]KKT02730.1 MAG: peptidase M23 [Candidatus Peregrinibacteria bacterium GW2011_GWF2_43_17]HAU39759.1 hypothetical protein [Candidatus Peregrinibacteria bacterium]
MGFIRKNLGLGLMLLLIFQMNSGIVLADESYELTEEQSEEAEELSEETVRSAYLILKLNAELNQKKHEYTLIGNQIEDAKTELTTLRESIDTLNEQIENLDALIAESEEKVRNVTSQIGEAETGIVQIMDDVEMRELQIEEQKDAAGKLMQILYVKKNVYYDDDDNLSTLKLVLAEGSVSDITQNTTYIEILEKTTEELLGDLDQNKRELDVRKGELEEKNVILAKLQGYLLAEKKSLDAELSGKESLLAETEGKETIYQDLLILSKQQQEEVASEVEKLQANIDLLEGKITADDLTDEELQEILNIKSEASDDNNDDASDYLQLDWPVSPEEKGLSAYFDDSGYVSAFGVAHNAIDIPVTQGTTIEAPADGVVYKVSYDENSIGYAYVMIAHRKGVVTVYGHVSAVAVVEGDYVYRGQIIGLTGGTPGTVGAGLRTTGAHLHFEVWQDGVLVDPLKYLDLAELPLDTLREDYLELLQAEVEAEIEEIEAEIEAMGK